MGVIIDFIIGLFQFVVFIGVVIAIIAFFGYNSLRALSEVIREAWSNIGVVGKKQASLVNQLIDVVKGYQESEKLVMLKISDDLNSASQVAQIYQQSNTILAAANGIAQRFPELKADQQYQRLIDSIQGSEAELETARQKYNQAVKHYNIKRSSIPHVFYAGTLGFKVAPYLEFVGSEQVIDAGSINSFSSDADGERLNALLGQAGAKVKEASTKAIAGGKVLASAAGEKVKQLAAEAGEYGASRDEQDNKDKPET
ncbi:LemA family protein [Methylobacillus arboreus]|uniref:LemA family protein n=1 Tax=Methylobacillus arboreus TaxID=755170 RepID=UPI001E28D403|nr:LemA family protein [Methylobacillus arboreus]MCB5189443.1 LemA family protein [Methylobacillus arboreus]